MDSNTIALVSVFFCCIVFIIIAYTINEKNAKYLLSGYNTMSKEEQEKFFINLGIYSFLIFILFYSIYDEITATIIWIISVFIPMPYMIYKGYKFKK